MTNPASTPVPVVDVQGDNRWNSVHQRYKHEAEEREPDVVFIGDSIIQHLQHSQIWESKFSQMHCLNFGMGADGTQNVLWRLQDGELEFTSPPKVIVIHCGTNNVSAGHNPSDILDGLKAIVHTIRQKVPDTKLVLLSLLPRGREPNPLRKKIAEINEMASAIEGVQFVKLDPGFIGADGIIKHHDMYDYLHLTNAGYEQAFGPVYELIQQLLMES